MIKKFFAFLLILVVIIIFVINWPKEKNIVSENKIEEDEEIIFPTKEFEQRITKKKFGMFITKDNSPVTPERFSGYHTGVDVEFQDVEEDVPVIAVCDGEIVLSRWVSGYGGTAILRCQNNYIVYGHLKVESITKNKQILKGEPIGILGEGNTKETDFERKHLHFGIHKNKIDLRGYVQNKEELSEWVDPISTLNTF